MWRTPSAAARLVCAATALVSKSVDHLDLHKPDPRRRRNCQRQHVLPIHIVPVRLFRETAEHGDTNAEVARNAAVRSLDASDLIGHGAVLCDGRSVVPCGRVAQEVPVDASSPAGHRAFLYLGVGYRS